MMATGFTVWVTGPDAGVVEGIGADIAARIEARRVPVELLDTHTPGLEDGDVAGRLACVAGALARHGVATVVAIPVPSRAARDRARAALGRSIEVWAHPLAGEAPFYEAPERAEVEIVSELDLGVGVERTLATLEVLGFLPRDDRAYSQDEEREVIRRLKAFGYV